MSARAVVAALALTAALAGCGGGSTRPPQTPSPTVTASGPADAVIAADGLLRVTDLGAGWQSEGPVPNVSPCPVDAVQALPEPSRPVSERFVETPAPSGLPSSAIEHVFVLPTLAATDTAFDGLVAAPFLDCVGNGLMQSLQTALGTGGTVEKGSWQPLDWPVTGQETRAFSLDLHVTPEAGTTRATATAPAPTAEGETAIAPGTATTEAGSVTATFAAVLARRGRALVLLEIAWFRPDESRRTLAAALRAAVGRLDAALTAPDDRVA
jgi:hypothetical protein